MDWKGGFIEYKKYYDMTFNTPIIKQIYSTFTIFWKHFKKSILALKWFRALQFNKPPKLWEDTHKKVFF